MKKLTNRIVITSIIIIVTGAALLLNTYPSKYEAALTTYIQGNNYAEISITFLQSIDTINAKLSEAELQTAQSYDSWREATKEIIQAVNESVKHIDFTVQEYPINTAIYNSETDKKYKEAFLKVITNEVPLKSMNYFRDDIIGTSTFTDDEFVEFIKHWNYYYLDFDGDGLPELITDYDGSDLQILKYDPEEDNVYRYKRYGQHWHILGSGKTYYYSTASAGLIKYAYESIGGENRDVYDSFELRIWFNSSAPTEYGISLEDDELDELGVSNEYLYELSDRKWIKMDKENWEIIISVFFGCN